MKYQAFFSSKDKSKKIKCRLLQILFGALRVKGRARTCEPYNTSETDLVKEREREREKN